MLLGMLQSKGGVTFYWRIGAKTTSRSQSQLQFTVGKVKCQLPRLGDFATLVALCVLAEPQRLSGQHSRKV